MVDAGAAQPILLAIVGGAIHASTYGTKAYIDGEDIELGKMMLTVVFGGLVGLLFAMVGYTPTATEWPILLAAYTGFIAELEAGLKLLVRGYVYESEARFRQAADEATEATADLATENRDRLIGGFLARAPKPAAADASVAAADADTAAEEDEEDRDDASLRLGLADESVPDPYPDTERGGDSHPGYAPKGDRPGENGDRLYQLSEWFNGNPNWSTSTRAPENDADDENDHDDVITDGP